MGPSTSENPRDGKPVRALATPEQSDGGSDAGESSRASEAAGAEKPSTDSGGAEGPVPSGDPTRPETPEDVPVSRGAGTSDAVEDTARTDEAHGGAQAPGEGVGESARATGRSGGGSANSHGGAGNLGADPVLGASSPTSGESAEEKGASTGAGNTVVGPTGAKSPAGESRATDSDKPSKGPGAAEGVATAGKVSLRKDAPFPAPTYVPRWRRVAYPAVALPGALVAGVVGALVLPWDRPGIGWLLAGIAITAAVFEVDRRARKSARARDSGGQRWRSPRVWWAATALALLAVGTFRAAGWLFALCLIGAALAGSLAIVPRRSAHGIVYDLLAVPLETLTVWPWAWEGVRRQGSTRAARTRRVGLTALATVAVVAVFAPLLGSADATFGALLNRLSPEIGGEVVFRWLVVGGIVVLGCLSCSYLIAGPPPAAGAKTSRSRRALRVSEWAPPVGALTALFAAFVVAQFAALFGGDDYVQRTANLTYAEYARSGFWQLSIVTMLALALILAVLRWGAQDSARDRTWLRGLLGAVTALSLVLVASALGRMWTYQQAYGFTVMRLLVEVFELWLGLVYVLVFAAVLRLRRAWLPRAAVGTALATLLALSILNPERVVADRNIDRWLDGKRLDTHYLGTLTSDSAPALSRLPASMRTEIEQSIRAGQPEDTWQSWNLSRASFR
ncbi:DUF4153 domain-containing protein [Nocardia puris]|uniref:Uncharacterized protein DUF4173 n=1 Tax=Nocardia puris TaxID=208602 RepID=A0A366DVS7_9NOCA|nr:DUF4153 domain-containing protein [Nocardia puris]RBO94177.1 uncharacterized protein DUF4173 [Nocardia puris]